MLENIKEKYEYKYKPAHKKFLRSTELLGRHKHKKFLSSVELLGRHKHKINKFS